MNCKWYKWIFTLSHAQHICSRQLWKVFGENTENLCTYANESIIVENSWKHCDKRRHYSLWAISPFISMFSQVTAAGVSKCICKWESGKAKHYHETSFSDHYIIFIHCSPASFMFQSENKYWAISSFVTMFSTLFSYLTFSHSYFPYHTFHLDVFKFDCCRIVVCDKAFL